MEGCDKPRGIQTLTKATSHIQTHLVGTRTVLDCASERNGDTEEQTSPIRTQQKSGICDIMAVCAHLGGIDHQRFAECPRISETATNGSVRIHGPPKASVVLDQYVVRVCADAVMLTECWRLKASTACMCWVSKGTHASAMVRRSRVRGYGESPEASTE